MDYTLSSSELREVNEPLVHLTFNLRDGERGRTAAVPVALSADKFRVLLAGEARGAAAGTPVPGGPGLLLPAALGGSPTASSLSPQS